MVHSFRRLTRVDPGFDWQGVLTARISLPETSYPQQEQKFAFVQQVMDELRATPGVESVSLTTTLPLMPYDLSSSIYIEGRPKPPPGMAPMVPVIRTSPGYFHTLKIPLVAGRAFNDADTASAPMVAIVNQSFARSFFPGEDALGKKFRIPLPDAWPVIVGIVADVHHLGLEKSASPEIYYPLRQSKIQDDGVAFVARARSLPGTATVLRNIVKKIDPNQPVFDIVSMEHQLAGSLAARKLNMILLAGFALLALALAAVGIYGVLSYSVAQRRHEIGIRMALGSDRGRVMKLVLREAVFLSLAGVIVGIAGALVLTRFMASLLYNTRASDPLTMVSVSALLITVGVVAGYVPAHRASKVDPMIALRAE
jgi:putative ABC transport system permease protein